MKKIILFGLMFTTVSAHARGKMRAFNTIDNGKTVTVIEPHIRGCANDMCYGGPGSYMLRPSFLAEKICKQLGHGHFVRGSKVVEEQMVSMVYGIVEYYMLERSGPPGAPAPTLRKIISSVECSKFNENMPSGSK